MKDLSCRTGLLLGGRSLRDLYTPSVGAPVGRDQESLCRPSGGRGEAGIHPTKWAPARQRTSFWQEMSIRRLVAGDGGVDGAGPGVDAAGEGLGVLEALVAEPHGDVEGAGTVVAEDDYLLIWVEFGVGAGGDLSHGHEERVGKGGGLVLPGLSYV